jgi:hypothetical protein
MNSVGTTLSYWPRAQSAVGRLLRVSIWVELLEASWICWPCDPVRVESLWIVREFAPWSLFSNANAPNNKRHEARFA